jgi:CheY-like chemotaxis protein
MAPTLPELCLRVAVIEDNRDSAASLTLLLELIGHEVQAAYAGPSGVELVRRWRPEAVISDLGLPGFDGFEVARRIRREPGMSEILLVALTGYGEDSFRSQSLEAGFNYHLVKPADPIVLQRLLAERAALLDAGEQE